jgi:hypothetical protein
VTTTCSGKPSCAGLPAGEVAVDAAQVGASAAVADVTVGPHQVLRYALDAEASTRLSVDIVQRARGDFAGQSLHGDEVAAALLQCGHVVCVPAVCGPAEEE